MSRRPKQRIRNPETSGRPIWKPRILENAGELTIPIIQCFLTYKYGITRHDGLVKNELKSVNMALVAHGYWVEGRKVNGKWQRFLNRLAHEMDKFYRNPSSVAVLLFGLWGHKRLWQPPPEISPEDITWLKRASSIGTYCKYPRMYPSPQDRFITDSMALGNRLGLFVDDNQEKAVRRLLIKISEVGDFTKLLPIDLQLHARVPSYFEPATGQLTLHDLLCLKIEAPKDPPK